MTGDDEDSCEADRSSIIVIIIIVMMTVVFMDTSTNLTA